MENTIPNVRFVHVINQEDSAKGAGATIAYQRQPDYLAFAWTDKRAGEPYVKAIGREYATQRLSTLLGAPNFGEIVARHPALLAFEQRMGVFHSDHLRAIMASQNVWSTNFVQSADWFSVKHAFISRFLVGEIGKLYA
jgi:hypothetical protein